MEIKLYFWIHWKFQYFKCFYSQIEIKILIFTRWKYQLPFCRKKINKNEVYLVNLQSKRFQLGFIWHYFVYNFLVPHAYCRYHISVLCFISHFLCHHILFQELDWISNCMLWLYAYHHTLWYSVKIICENCNFVENCNFCGVPDYPCCLLLLT